MRDERITVRPVRPEDSAAWMRMRASLWPDSVNDSEAEIMAYFAGNAHMPAMVLVACDERNKLIGFAELSLRLYAEGCASSPVLYLEGWYVEPEWRRQGVGTRLIREAEAWGRSKGCREFASDALIDNEAAHRAHNATGFAEVERIVCFKKTL